MPTNLDIIKQLHRENARLRETLERRGPPRVQPSNLIGRSKAMAALMDQVARVGPSETSVLIQGESGVGKELIARAIHRQSPRCHRPLVRVNCAALPRTLLESELFGHERGAFTGATARRQGLFERAHRGTLFLDEIGEFPLSTQALLLRVLQEGELDRVGGSEPLEVDVRLMVATNANLERRVAAGTFREDLYYRLNVYPIRVPTLRERKTDIPLLADHFGERFSRAVDKAVLRISTPAIDLLMAYHWPGNVRELENCIERAVLLSDDGVIHAHHLPPTLQTPDSTDTGPKGKLQDALDRLEQELLVDALKEARGNRAGAARVLGITERVMGLRVARHGIDARRFRRAN